MLVARSARAVFLYYRADQAEKRMTLHRRGRAHPRHHLHDDARRHALRRRVASCCMHDYRVVRLRAARRTGRARAPQARTVARALSAAARERRGRRLRALPVTRPARSSRCCSTGAGLRRAHRSRARGLLDALRRSCSSSSTSFRTRSTSTSSRRSPTSSPRDLTPRGRLQPMAENAARS